MINLPAWVRNRVIWWSVSVLAIVASLAFALR